MRAGRFRGTVATRWKNRREGTNASHKLDYAPRKRINYPAPRCARVSPSYAFSVSSARCDDLSPIAICVSRGTENTTQRSISFGGGMVFHLARHEQWNAGQRACHSRRKSCAAFDVCYLMGNKLFPPSSNSPSAPFLPRSRAPINSVARPDRRLLPPAPSRRPRARDVQRDRAREPRVKAGGSLKNTKSCRESYTRRLIDLFNIAVRRSADSLESTRYIDCLSGRAESGIHIYARTRNRMQAQSAVHRYEIQREPQARTLSMASFNTLR